MMKSNFLAFVVLAFLALVSCNQPNKSTDTTTIDKVGKIAYVNTDTLMEKYQFAIDLNEEFTKKQENMTADLNVKAKKVEDMIKSFKYRAQNNAFASRERAEQEQRHIEKKRQELIELDQTLKQELSEDYQEIINRLQDTLTRALEIFNKEVGYDLILRTTKGGNVLFGKPELDITEDFVKQLNNAYRGKEVADNKDSKSTKESKK